MPLLCAHVHMNLHTNITVSWIHSKNTRFDIHRGLHKYNNCVCLLNTKGNREAFLDYIIVFNKIEISF